MLTLNNERLNLPKTILQVAEDIRNQITPDKNNVTIIYDVMNPKNSKQKRTRKYRYRVGQR